MRTIYIAGPDVFAPNANEIGKRYKELCKKYGFRGVYPLDGSSMTSDSVITSRKIFGKCIGSIVDADLVIANLNSFRGKCVDDGTAFEVGFAVANGKPVFGYVDDSRDLKTRFGTHDENGWVYEDFGLPVNIMLAEACTKIVQGDFEACLLQVGQYYNPPKFMNRPYAF